MKKLVFLLGVVLAGSGALAQAPAHLGPGPSRFIAGPGGCPSGGNALVATPPDQVFLYISDADFPQTLAIQFTLLGATTLGEVVIIGGYAAANTPPGGETFRVVVRNDGGGGVPGTIISDEPGIVPTSFTQTGVVLFDVDEMEAVLPLSPVPLVAGTYWIEIFEETPDPDDHWHWETGSPVDANQSPSSAYAFEIPGGTNWLVLGGRTLALTLCDASIPVELIEFVVE